ncbi:MAG: YbhB/YbcL family Raf kinase inhibitor-like protein [Bdellovibrionales bacterium]|nr:YbhB/YbcL family Raf kinase inhibitor-like protein [Bdellovibrionales bacterium]
MSKSNSLFALILAFTLTSFAHAEGFTVTSSVVKAGETMTNDQVFNGFGCTGKNVSPDLKWEGAPADAKTFAVTMYDPDAPTGSGWWHWTVFNLPAGTKELKAGASHAKGGLPKGAVQGMTDFGKSGYGGPCPPAGDKPHRYIFKVFALKDKLPLDAKAPGAMVGFYLNQLKLGEATLEAKFGR